MASPTQAKDTQVDNAADTSIASGGASSTDPTGSNGSFTSASSGKADTSTSSSLEAISSDSSITQSEQMHSQSARQTQSDQSSASNDPAPTSPSSTSQSVSASETSSSSPRSSPSSTASSSPVSTPAQPSSTTSSSSYETSTSTSQPASQTTSAASSSSTSPTSRSASSSETQSSAQSRSTGETSFSSSVTSSSSSTASSTDTSGTPTETSAGSSTVPDSTTVSVPSASSTEVAATTDVSPSPTASSSPVTIPNVDSSAGASETLLSSQATEPAVNTVATVSQSVAQVPTSDGITTPIEITASDGTRLSQLETAQTVAQINNVPASTDGTELITYTDSQGRPTATVTKTPSLNGADDNVPTGTKIVAGTVGGIVAVIVVVAAIIWLLGKRRRDKFVKPIVERLHTTGSAYSLPGLLGGSRGHQRRRSRAFSIESAESYDPVLFETYRDAESPPRRSPGSSRLRHDMTQIYRHTTREDTTSFLPHGAAPYPHRAQPRVVDTDESSSNETHGRSDGSSNGFGRIGRGLSPSEDSHATTVLDYAHGSPEGEVLEALQSPLSARRYKPPPPLTTHAAPSQHLLLPEFPTSPLAADASSPNPLLSDNPYLPRSPTMQPTILQRRTTDPFPHKRSLRVINPDLRQSSQSTASVRSPISPIDASRMSTPSFMTTDNEFFYDEDESSHRMSPLPASEDVSSVMRLSGVPQRIRRESQATARSVHTPKPVHTVGFFGAD